MEEAALKLFNSINGYSDIEEFIDEGQSEGIYLECKSPQAPKLGRDLRAQLAEAISGFANTEGGIIIWGVSTTKKSHSDLDIMTQIEEIGNCKNFMSQIEKNYPTLVTPSITNIQNKAIKKNKKDNRGLIITYIPKNKGDPVKSNIDDHFYFRNGDEFSKMPYEILKRLFAATESPELRMVTDFRLIKKNERDVWEVPLIITNMSSAVAKYVNLFIRINNDDNCESITSDSLNDVSQINPGVKVFHKEPGTVIHRGSNHLAGKLIIKMKKNIRSKRVLKISIEIFADKMRAIREDISLYLSNKGVSAKKTKQEYIY